MKNQFEPLAMGEVLSVDESALFLIGHHTFRVGEIAEAIRVQLEYAISGWSQEKDAWFSEEGIPCEVLRFSAQGWQKGKVRIHLEFCPQEAEQEDKGTSALAEDDEFAVAAPTEEEEVNFAESPSSSVIIDKGLAVAAAVGAADALDLLESPTNQEDELELEIPAVSDVEQEHESPMDIYVEMHQEVVSFADDELEITQTQISLEEDIDLGEMEESIDQDLELLEAPEASDNDFMDFGEMSSGGDEDLDFGEMSSGSDEDLDFGEMSSGSDEDLDFGEINLGNEDEFQFEDISLNNELEDNEDDSLLDDVWQDINNPK